MSTVVFRIRGNSFLPAPADGTWSAAVGRDFPGIPYPTSAVPSAIMPTLPTGADFTTHDWTSSSYDPITTPAPTWPGDGENNYYVKYNGVDASAGNGGRGNPASPRRTLPTQPTGGFPAGTKIFVEGDNTPITTTGSDNRKVDFTNWGAANFNITFLGTKDDPCWVVGINKPRIASRVLTWTADTRHLIFDGIVMETGQNTSYRGSIQTLGNYTVFRNGWMFGNHNDQGHNQFDMAGTAQFSVFYNSEIGWCGLYDAVGPLSRDWHGWRPSLAPVRYHWAIGNHIHHMQGDCCQIGNTETTDPGQANVPHYCYFVGNHVHHAHEQGFDRKDSYHIFCAYNEAHDNGLNGNGIDDGIVVGQDFSDSKLVNYGWVFGNVCYNQTNAGIRFTSDNATMHIKHYVFGNLCYDCGSGVSIGHGTKIAAAGSSLDEYILFNTIANCDSGIFVNNFNVQNDQGDLTTNSLFIQGNILYNCTVDMFDQDSRYYDVIDIRDNLSNGNTNQLTATSSSGNLVNTNPLFVDSGTNDYRLQAGSPAIDVGTKPSIYDTFEAMYGIKITKDAAGNLRPDASTGWDLGYLEKA